MEYQDYMSIELLALRRRETFSDGNANVDVHRRLSSIVHLNS